MFCYFFTFSVLSVFYLFTSRGFGILLCVTRFCIYYMSKGLIHDTSMAISFQDIVLPKVLNVFD